jgi:hypothetical protein
MESASDFLERAALCRRLAAGIVIPNDPTAEALLTLSREFDLKAAAIEAWNATARQIRHGYIVPIAGGDGADTEAMDG